MENMSVVFENILRLIFIEFEVVNQIELRKLIIRFLRQVNVKQLMLEDGRMIPASKFGKNGFEEKVDIEFNAEEKVLEGDILVNNLLMTKLFTQLK